MKPPLRKGVEEDPIPDGFIAWLCKASAPRLDPFEGLPVVQVEFHSESVPWVLSEAEPT
jgi:hypothetical protein